MAPKIKYDFPVGTKFGYLTVTGVGKKFTGGKYRRAFKVRCVCGTEFSTQPGLLAAGKSKSCGCRKKTFRKRIFLTLDVGTYHINGIVRKFKVYQKTARRKAEREQITLTDAYNKLIERKLNACE